MKKQLKELAGAGDMATVDDLLIFSNVEPTDNTLAIWEGDFFEKHKPDTLIVFADRNDPTAYKLYIRKDSVYSSKHNFAPEWWELEAYESHQNTILTLLRLRGYDV